MIKIKFVAIVLLLVTVGVLPVLAGCTSSAPASCANYTILIGGGFPLTVAYPEDGLAVLDAFQDYAQWVNANHCISPWQSNLTLASNITLQVVSLDDQGINPTLAQTDYATLKAAGLKVWRISGTPIGTAMKAQLFGDQCGATSQASGAWVETGGSGSIFMVYPLYTEQMAAVADWFITGNSTINPNGWNVTHPAGGNYTKPRAAYLTNGTFGGTGSLIVASLNTYLTTIGYNLTDTNPHRATGAGSDTYSPADALTSLTWCVSNNVDLTLGAMTCPTAEQLMSLADNMSIGRYDMNYTMQVALCSPAHAVVYMRDVTAAGNSTRGNGLVVAGSYPTGVTPP